MKITTLLIIAILLASCGTSRPAKPPAATPQKSYKLTDSEKTGNVLYLTFTTDWRSIQCSAAIDGLKIGSGQGNSLAGVAKVSIFVPTKYEKRPASEFVVECTQF